MFKTRLLSGIILMVITITLVVIGGNLLFTTTAIISVIGMAELNRSVKKHLTLPAILGYCAGLTYYLLLYFNNSQYYTTFFILFLMVLMVVYVFTFPKYKIEDITIVYFGLFYVSIMLSYIYQVRMLEDGSLLVWLIFIGAWGSDTCAYCTGMLFGKHKLTPKLSPKKTVEGSIGGVVGAALIGFIYASFFKDSITDISNPQLAFAIIGGASSIIAQIGDFAASAVKRNHDIKDYGNLIPGHGGILDRFDSIIFTAPSPLFFK
ncbi:MAG: phosphatidate cytidylyltransferase [Clostridiales bacterium]|nr:phosphatidate cytidylyltransferase [Clostridiales bacterium]